jgi:hypothetical protein
MLFLASSDERRAHGVGGFSATSAPIALFEVANERLIFESERKARFERQRREGPVPPQVTINLIPPVRDDFSWIKDVIRVEHGFDFPHHPQQRFPDLVSHELGSSNPHAVLSRQRTLEPFHQF